MKGDFRKLGIWLMGSGLTFAALYLIGTAASLGSGHPAPLFPYWIFLGLCVVGGSLYLITPVRTLAAPAQAPRTGVVVGGAEHARHEPVTDEHAVSDRMAKQLRQVPVDEPAGADRPAFTDRWRFTVNGHEVVPQVARVGQMSIDHPAYSRPAESTPAYFRTMILIACSQLGDSLGSQDLRRRFHELLAGSPFTILITDLIGGRADMRGSMRWEPRATSRRPNLKADLLTSDDPTEVPIASAVLELPAPGLRPMGSDPRCAELILHVDMPAVDIVPGLPGWRRRLARVLTLPTETASWLERLGLATFADPPAQLGIILQARTSIKDMVNPGSIKALRGSDYVLNEWIGYAVASADGQDADNTAGRMILELSERVLHLDGPEDELSGRVVPAPVPPGIMANTWASRDLPVLRVVVRRLDENGAYAVTVAEISDEIGIDMEVVAKSLDALNGPYVTMYQKLLTGGDPGPWFVTEVAPAARRAVGQWPM